MAADLVSSSSPGSFSLALALALEVEAIVALASAVRFLGGPFLGDFSTAVGAEIR